MIRDEDIEKAIDYLEKSAVDASQARANRIYLEGYSKTLKAMLMKKFPEHSISAQEREALAHPEYQHHLDGLKVAVEEDERHRFLRVAMEAKIEAWRSHSANIRAIKI